MEKDNPQSPKSSDQAQQSPNDRERTLSVVPVTGTNEPTQERETKPAYCCKNPDKFWDLKASHWITVILTGALVFVGLSQCSVYNRQASIMTSQTAILSAQESDQRIFQRPFVYLAGLLDIYISSPAGPVIRINPMWSNSGNTPTADLKIYASWKQTSELLPKGFKFPDLDDEGNEITNPAIGQTFLPPKGPPILGRDKVIGSTQMQAINDSGGHTVLWGWGWARYKDHFGDSHITRFCVAIGKFILPGPQQLSVVGIVPGGLIEWKFCDEGNCADEECKEQ